MKANYFLNRVAASVCLIHGLLFVQQGYTELAMPLADLPANLYTVSELVRLCLRHNDDVDSLSDDGVDETDEYTVVSDSDVQSTCCSHHL